MSEGSSFYTGHQLPLGCISLPPRSLSKNSLSAFVCLCHLVASHTNSDGRGKGKKKNCLKEKYTSSLLFSLYGHNSLLSEMVVTAILLVLFFFLFLKISQTDIIMWE